MNLDRTIAAITGLLMVALWATPYAVATDELESKLSSGQVITSYRKEGDIDYVVAKIRISHAPNRIWSVLANPFEFQEKISPHFKTVRIIEDRADLSILQCKVDFGFFLPSLKYTVESHYEPGRRITFQSTAGDIKELRGVWEISPVAGGTACDVSYSMYVNPGFPVPQWFIRQAIKCDLPRTLNGLSKRVDEIYTYKDPPVRRSLVSTGCTAAIRRI